MADDKLNSVTKKGTELWARGESTLNRIGKGQHDKKDIPFAVADTLAGVAGTMAGGTVDAAREGARLGMKKLRGK